MTNTHHAEMRELVIGRNLSWMSDNFYLTERHMRWLLFCELERGVGKTAISVNLRPTAV